MNTTDMIRLLAKRLKISQKHAHKLVHMHFTAISEHLKAGKKVVLRGFGSFEVKQTKPREMRLPSNGLKVLIPSRKVVNYRPSQRLKDEVKIWRPSDG